MEVLPIHDQTTITLEVHHSNFLEQEEAVFADLVSVGKQNLVHRDDLKSKVKEASVDLQELFIKSVEVHDDLL